MDFTSQGGRSAQSLFQFGDEQQHWKVVLGSVRLADHRGETGLPLCPCVFPESVQVHIPVIVNTVPIDPEQSERSEGSAFRMSLR